jgi:hypothetical protein
MLQAAEYTFTTITTFGLFNSIFGISRICCIEGNGANDSTSVRDIQAWLICKLPSRYRNMYVVLMIRDLPNLK